jgi:hypothetical protein
MASENKKSYKLLIRRLKKDNFIMWGLFAQEDI